MYGLSTIIGRLLNVLLVPLYTHQFTPEQYGRVSLVFTMLAFLQVVYLMGMETAFFRYSSGEDRHDAPLSNALVAVVPFSFLCSLMLWLFAGQVADVWLGGVEYQHLIRWASVILLMDALAALPFAELRRRHKALRFALIKLGNIGLNLIANLVLLIGLPFAFQQGWMEAEPLAWYPENQPVVLIFWANALASGLAVLLLLPQVRLVPARISMQTINTMLAYGLPLVGVGLAAMANETLDRFLLKWWLPGPPAARIAQIGIYAACYKFSIFMTLVVQAFRYAAEPFFFARAQEENAPHTYAFIMQLFILAGGAIVLGVSLSMDILKNAIDARYHEGIQIVPVLLFANLFLGIYYNLSVWYKISGKTQTGAWVALSGVGITLAANAVLIPAFQYFGAAWATLACYAGMSLLSLLLSRRYYPIPYALPRIGLYLMVIAAFTTVGWWLMHAGNGLATGWRWSLAALLMFAYLLFGYAMERSIFDRLIKTRTRSD